MIQVSLLSMAKILNSDLIGPDRQVIEVTTDTRKVRDGCLFIALKGKRFDAHEFCTHAVIAGARALLVSRRLALDTPQLVVKDTRLALGQLATWVRQQVPARVIALTGSSGKTSVKEMTAAILSECGEVLYTEDNFNNDIGVALTLLRLKAQHHFAVIELGGNHIGEIAYTSALTLPNTALINNLAPAHLEGFGSLSGVAQAKGEIFTGLLANGIAIINEDNNDWTQWKSMLSAKTVWRFSEKAKKGADFFAKNIRSEGSNTYFQLHTPFGRAEMAISLPGRHNVANALASSALAMSIGAPLKAVCRGLKKFRAVPGRIFPIVLTSNKLLLDDSYNANIGSMLAAIKVLAEMPGYRVMVVGDIDELGTLEKKYHAQMGNIAYLLGINKVISIGYLSSVLSEASGNGEHYQNKKDVVDRVRGLLEKHEIITVLIKGSRRSGMEQVVYALQEKSNASLLL